MKTHTLSVLIILLIATCESCWYPYTPEYNPPAQLRLEKDKFFTPQTYKDESPFRLKDGNLNAPLLRNKGELNLAMNTFNGISLHSAYAISNKIAVELSGAIVSNDDYRGQERFMDLTRYVYNGHTYDTSQAFINVKYGLDHSLTEQSIQIGAGYYKAFKAHGSWENYIGLAYGHAENSYTYRINNVGDQSTLYMDQYTFPFKETRNYFQPFIQENLGYVTQHTEGALIGRVSWVHFKQRSFEKSYPVQVSDMTRDNIVFQPGLKFGIGGKVLRFYMQCGWNISLSNSDMKWSETNFQSGILLRFGRKNS